MTMAETDNFLKLLRNPQEMERALWKEPLTKNQILVFLFSSPTQWSCAPGKSLWDSAFWSPNLKNEDKSYPDHLTKQL